MLEDVKISLTINVAGSTRQVLGFKEIPVLLTKQDLTRQKLPTKIANKIVVKKKVKVPNYEYKKAQVHINMYRSAYEYFISKEKPEHYFKKDWSRLTPKARLEWHMAYIASSYNSNEYSYNILED